MPRVHKVKRTSGGTKEYICVNCHKPIVAGEEYYHWTKYRQPVRQQHVKCGYPKRSQLSDSKMGPVWDAVDDFSGSVDINELKDILSGIAATANEVASEYSEAADGIESTFSSGSATAEACREVAEALESWATDLENWEPDSDEPESEDEKEAWLEEQINTAQDLVNEAPEYNG